MHEIIDVVESTRFTEEQVLHVALQLDVLHPFEPHQLTLVRAVEEGGTESLCLTDADRVPFGDLTDDLHVCILIVQFGDFIEPTAVDILIGILTNQVKRGIHA